MKQTYRDRRLTHDQRRMDVEMIWTLLQHQIHHAKISVWLVEQKLDQHHSYGYQIPRRAANDDPNYGIGWQGMHGEEKSHCVLMDHSSDNLKGYHQHYC